MNIEHNKSLLAYNTFHIDETAAEFTVVNDENQLDEIISYAGDHNKKVRIIGGGSNILLTQKADCLVILNQLKGVVITASTAAYTDIQFMSGENWHQCVRYCVERNLGGIENLSLIPGSIGAAPIQNIGAYGAELKDVFVSLSAIHMQTRQKETFDLAQCAFGYRDSIFKQEAYRHYFIISVTLRLQNEPQFNTGYGDLQQVLKEDFQGIVNLKNISDAVIKIRRAKLPDPEVTGNAGSFFKNPVIDPVQAHQLKQTYENMPSFPVDNGVKIPAAWLIEQCGWKGYQATNYGVHTRQALVLVNYSNAKGSELLNLSAEIITSVQQRFNILLEREVNIW
jgi:UDP-N-acetylmuramate dehydrogenase